MSALQNNLPINTNELGVSRKDFLAVILPEPVEGETYCAVNIKNGKVKQEFYNTIKGISDSSTQALIWESDSYYSMATYIQPSKGSPNRKKESVRRFKSLWIDLDISDGTAFPTQKDGLLALKEFIKATGLPKPTIVSSGIGLHIYFTLNQAIELAQWEPLAHALKARIISEGFKVKDTGVSIDAVRILRLPETVNYKKGKKTDVKLLCLGESLDLAEYQGLFLVNEVNDQLSFLDDISKMPLKKTLNTTTLALIGSNDLPDNFPCNDANKDLLRKAVGELYQREKIECSKAEKKPKDGYILPYQEYFKVVCAFKSLTPMVGWTDDEAFNLYDEVCKQMGGYDNEKNLDKWITHTPRIGRPATYKSLLAEIKQDLSKHNLTDYEEEMDIVVLLASGKVFDTSNISKELLNKARHRLSNLNGESGHGTRSFNFIEKDIVSLKTVHKQYSLLHIPEQPVVVVDTKTGSLLRMGELNLLLGDKCCLLGFDKTKWGPVPVYRDAFDVWKCARGKNKLTSIVMTKNPKKLYEWNLFKGYGVTATQGSCELIRQHIKEVICAGDDVVYEAFLNLLAWQFQQVGKPSRIIVAIRSTEQQIGKSLLTEYLEKMLGVSYFYSNDAANVFSKFNSQIRGKILVVLDEAVFAKDLKLAAIIKSTATAASIPSEEKFVKPILLPSGINILITTNEEHIAHIERSDARYWIITASPHKFGDTNYFLSVVDERDNGGGAEAFLWFLLNRDVSNFIPSRDVPKNNAELDIAKALSAAPLSTADWLQHSIDSERLLGFFIDSNLEGFTEGMECMVWPENHKKVKAGRLYHAYTIWVNRTKAHRSCSPSTGRAFWDVLTAVGFTPDANSNRTIPSITELKNNLATYLAGKNRVISE